MGNIQSHKELHVWQDAMDGAMEIYEITKAFPPDEAGFYKTGCRELDALELTYKRHKGDGEATASERREADACRFCRI